MLTTRNLCEERANRRQNTMTSTKCGNTAQTRMFATYRVLAHLHGYYTSGTGGWILRKRLRVLYKAAKLHSLPAVVNQSLASVLCCHREDGQERNVYVCECKPENLTSEREKFLANNAKCVKVNVHTCIRVLHTVRHTYSRNISNSELILCPFAHFTGFDFCSTFFTR
jgi:hypothetical protein